MLRWMAPFLSFTAEEAWKVFGPTGSASIFTETYCDARRWADEALLAKWKRIREIRDAVEQGRSRRCAPTGKLGSSLQAERGDRAPAAGDCVALAALGDDLKFVLITSAVDAGSARRRRCAVAGRRRAAPPSASAAGTTATTSAPMPAIPTICGRCTSNLFGAGEAATRRLMAARRSAVELLALARHRRWW